MMSPEQLLPPARLPAPVQDHVMRRPLLRPRLVARDPVRGVGVQPHGGAEVGLRPLHLRPRHLYREPLHVLH